MNILSFITLLTVCFFGGQDSVRSVAKEAVNPGVRFEIEPFIIETETEHLRLDNLKGTALLCLALNKKGQVESFTINVLKLIHENDTLVNYIDFTSQKTCKGSYPKSVSKYYPDLSNYVDKLIIIPREGVKNEEHATCTMYVKVKIDNK